MDDNSSSSGLSSPPSSDEFLSAPSSPRSDAGSDTSDLSELSRSPTPQPENMIRSRAFPYPSPPASQHTSHKGSPTPTPDGMDAAASIDKDGPPPAKRRRVTKERTTEHLDLRSSTVDPDQQHLLDRLLKVLHKRRKIVVVAGAGISVSAGIPDFRSSTGLFTTLKAEHKLRGSGKDLFDASVYKDDTATSSFHTMVSSMSRLTRDAKPTAFHHLLATLAQEGRLMRLYSQNVDGIDTGIEPLKTNVPLHKDGDGKWPKTVQLHGGLDKMVCSKCHALSDFDADLFDGPMAPPCSACETINDIRTNLEGKRSHGIGRLRPRMVLYNEHNPDDEAIGAVTREDLRRRPDAVVVVGTTLKVPGVRRIVREMCGVVRDRKDGVAVWINNDPPPSGIQFEDCWDIVVQGSSDAVANRAALRRWDEPLQPEELDEPSIEDLRKANATKGEVVVHLAPLPLPSEKHYNNSFRAPSSDASPIQPDSPPYSPMTSRHHSIYPSIEGQLDSDSTVVEGSDTIELAYSYPSPKNSQKSTPQKALPLFSDRIMDAGKKIAPKKTKAAKGTRKPPAKSAKTAAAKSKSKTAAKGPKPPSVAGMLKVGKTAAVAGKDVKDDPSSPSKCVKSKLRQVSTRSSSPDSVQSQELPPQDLRSNLSPTKSRDLFSNVAPKASLTGKKRTMSIAGMLQ